MNKYHSHPKLKKMWNAWNDEQIISIIGMVK